MGRWQQIEAILVEARELDEVEQSSFLSRACGDDADLRQEVESLLRAGEEDHSMFKEPLLECRLQPGRRLGPYLIMRELGRGGMGTVYLAQQEQPIQRLVAIKFIGFITLDEERLKRFQVEQRLLAQMTHSNIAKLYESGTTLDGMPYFVMEYIEGLPITTFCDQHRLTLQERLTLFAKVCEALNSAHLKGVIHRDIKPANILVMMENRVPTPKIIDFGIAKPLAETSGMTQLKNQPGTPRYMSPEQMGLATPAGRCVEPDFRTDVYNLGVLLYELLVGVHPFEWEDNPSREEIRRSICWDEPKKPTGRWDRLPVQKQQQLADLRNQSPGAIRRTLQDDLEWIVMRALEKEPNERYQSIREMSADLQRYGQGMPISAGPTSLGYRVTKFVRRNRLMVSAACLIFLVLIAFSVMLAVKNQQILAERDRARQERDTATQVTDFMVETLGNVDPYRQEGSENLQVDTLLERARNRLEKDTIKAPHVRSKLAEALATVHASLGKHDEAIQLYLEADRLAQQAYGEDTLQVAEIRIILADSYGRIGRHDDAIPIAEQAVTVHRKVLGDGHPDSAYAMAILGNMLISVGRLQEAEDFLQKAILPIVDQPEENLEANIFTNASLGYLYYQQGRYQLALDHFTEGYNLDVKIRGEDHLDTAASLANLSAIAFALGKYDEAKANWLKSLTVHERFLGTHHPTVALIYNNLAMVAEKTHDFDQAERMMRKAIGIRNTLGHKNTNFAEQHLNLGLVLYAKGQFCEAMTEVEFGLAMLADIVDEGHYLLSNAYGHLGRLQIRMGNISAAANSTHEALKIALNQQTPVYQDMAIAYMRFATIHNTLGNWEAAEYCALQALQSLGTALPPDHRLHLSILGELGTAWLATGRYAEAEAVLLERRDALAGTQDREAEMSRDQLAELYRRWNKGEPKTKPLPSIPASPAP